MPISSSRCDLISSSVRGCRGHEAPRKEPVPTAHDMVLVYYAVECYPWGGGQWQESSPPLPSKKNLAEAKMYVWLKQTRLVSRALLHRPSPLLRVRLGRLCRSRRLHGPNIEFASTHQRMRTITYLSNTIAIRTKNKFRSQTRLTHT
jgi:hypothetical protein